MLPDMKKRALATVLWSLTGWYAGAVVGWMLGVGSVAAPILALAAALLIVGDPFGLFSGRATAPASAPATAPTPDLTPQGV